MDKSFAQIRMAATISQSGLSEAQVAAVLGVSQSTVSRLRNCLIQKVEKYQLILDNHLGASRSDGTSEFQDLFAMATLSPPLRDALIAIRRLMQEKRIDGRRVFCVCEHDPAASLDGHLAAVSRPRVP